MQILHEIMQILHEITHHFQHVSRAYRIRTKDQVGNQPILLVLLRVLAYMMHHAFTMDLANVCQNLMAWYAIKVGLGQSFQTFLTRDPYFYRY